NLMRNNIIAASAATENEPGALDQMPFPLFKAFGLLKKSYALANKRFGLENNICKAILQACGEAVTDNLHNHSSLNICEKRVKYTNQYESLNNLHTAIKQCEESARIYEMARGLARVNIPETLGNEFSAYADQVSTRIRRLKTCAEFLFELPINDTPVGTLICTPQGVGKYLVESLNQLTQLKFIDVSNKFQTLATYNRMVEISGNLNSLAIILAEIHHEVCLLPHKPTNSMMTSTLNITQSDTLKGIARQVIQHLIDVAITAPFERSEYNRFKAVAIHSILRSIQMIINAANSLTVNVSQINWTLTTNDVSNEAACPLASIEKIIQNLH
ncbi:unnamed protein product, partial [Rotaria magnacalcarata]